MAEEKDRVIAPPGGIRWFLPALQEEIPMFPEDQHHQPPEELLSPQRLQLQQLFHKLQEGQLQILQTLRMEAVQVVIHQQHVNLLQVQELTDPNIIQPTGLILLRTIIPE